MKTKKSLKIIDGDFSHEEARQILMSMFLSKIDYHIQKNWSSQERYGETDVNAMMRVASLKNEMKKLETLLDEAKSENKRLLINSEILITKL